MQTINRDVGTFMGGCRSRPVPRKPFTGFGIWLRRIQRRMAQARNCEAAVLVRRYEVLCDRDFGS